jgi:hypothetical protein
MHLRHEMEANFTIKNVYVCTGVNYKNRNLITLQMLINSVCTLEWR